MILPNWLYDLLKWTAIICLPAFKVAIPAFFETWNIPYGEQIANSVDIVAVLLGTLIGASCATYNTKSNTVTLTADVEDVEHQLEAEDDTDKG